VRARAQKVIAGMQTEVARCIIINDYSTPTVAQKEKFLETFTASKTSPR
jgi:hypothetical protein